MKHERTTLGIASTGEVISQYRLIAANQLSVTVSDWGATVTSITTPDAQGRSAEVTLTPAGLENLIKNPCYMGSTIGRCCNRIADAKFRLNGNVHHLIPNEHPHHLHGGTHGFSHRRWESKFENDKVVMSLLSNDGEEGYPGNLCVNVTFTIDEENQLHIDYEAKSDKDTVLNLTNHCYFNLSGDYGSTICDHQFEVFANGWLEADSRDIPTGKTIPICNEGGFKHPARIGDSNLNRYYCTPGNNKLNKVCEVYEPQSGRTLEVITDQPGFVIYNGFGIPRHNGHKGANYGPFSGFCVETQRPPNAINEPSFPSTILKAGDVFKSKTIYRFGISS